MVNALRPRQNGRHFADDIFKCIFLNENVWIPLKTSLTFVPKGPINNIPTLVQVMAWRRSGDKPLSEPMVVNSSTHICVTRPQWVKTLWGSLLSIPYLLCVMGALIVCYCHIIVEKLWWPVNPHKQGAPQAISSTPGCCGFHGDLEHYMSYLCMDSVKFVVEGPGAKRITGALLFGGGATILW